MAGQDRLAMEANFANSIVVSSVAQPSKRQMSPRHTSHVSSLRVRKRWKIRRQRRRHRRRQQSAVAVAVEEAADEVAEEAAEAAAAEAARGYTEAYPHLYSWMATAVE